MSSTYVNIPSGNEVLDNILAGTNVTIDRTESDITINASGGGSGSPGGTDTEVQFNDAGDFGGVATFKFNKALPSLKMGTSNIASGANAMATGTSNITSGLNSHGEGNGNIASGINAHSEGSGNVSAGSQSHSAGLGTNAQGDNQTVVGQYNIAVGTPTSPASTDEIFTVGNGVDDADRATALAILRDGSLKDGSGSVGTSGKVLTSNGTGSPPTWQAGGGGGYTPPTSRVRVVSCPGYSSAAGSTIYYFSTVQINAPGSDFTYTADAVNGDKYTINVNGTFTIALGLNQSGTAADVGLSLNASGADLTTAYHSLAATKQLTPILSAPGSAIGVEATKTWYFPAGSVIRPHGGGGNSSNLPAEYFEIIRLS